MTTFDYNITPKTDGPEIHDNIIITSDRLLTSDQLNEFGEYMRQALKEYLDAEVELMNIYLNNNE